MRRLRGFTMVELLVVLAVVALLLSLVAPRYLHQADRAREAALKENLVSLRSSLDQYYADKGRYPERLEQLVEARYLRAIPEDPVTRERSTWQVVTLNEEGLVGIYDVKSGAPGSALDGTAYASW